MWSLTPVKIIVLILLFIDKSDVAATKKDDARKKSIETVLYKRERNKINSLARALQLEHALYQDDTAMRLAALSDQINRGRR